MTTTPMSTLALTFSSFKPQFLGIRLLTRFTYVVRRALHTDLRRCA